MVAIKCIQKSSLSKTATENLLTEIELLKKLDHEHIVKLKDFEVSVTILTTFIFFYVNHCFRRKLLYVGLFEFGKPLVYILFMFMGIIVQNGMSKHYLKLSTDFINYLQKVSVFE